MKIGWAILAGLLLGGGLAWWFGHHGRVDTPAVSADGTTTTQVRSLYRWHDADGLLHITDAPPPKGIAFERIPLEGSGENQVTAPR